jgi:hypothetical protein
MAIIQGLGRRHFLREIATFGAALKTGRLLAYPASSGVQDTSGTPEPKTLREQKTVPINRALEQRRDASASTRESNPPKNIPSWEQDASDIWYEGALLGNGDLGVSVFGANDQITFAIGKNDFWDRRYSKEPSLQLQTPKPVCRVNLSKVGAVGDTVRRPLQPIRHALSLAEAELETTSPVLRLVTRVQKTRNLIFIRVTSGAEGSILSLSRREDTTGTSIPAPIHKVESEVGFVIQDLPPESTYPHGFRCAVAGSLNNRSMPQVFPDKMVWRPTGECTLLLAVATTRDHPNPEGAARALLLDALGREADLRREHLAAWREFWDASWIALDDPELERLWFVHNYLLACAARPGAVAPGMFGPWIVQDKSAWHGGYIMNYNFEQAFAAALSCNHPELLEPYFEVIENVAPAGERFAREAFKAEGLVFPHLIYPLDMTNLPLESVLTSDQAWMIQHFWEYYEHTLDSNFLKQRAYRLIAGCADFLASFATRAEDGSYFFHPSFQVEARETRHFNRNGTADLAFARYLLKAALKAAAIVSDNSGRVGRWREVLTGLPDYARFRVQQGEILVDIEATSLEKQFLPPVDARKCIESGVGFRPSKCPGNQGAWRIQNYPDRLIPVWPAGQIDADSPPEEVLAALRTLWTLHTEGVNDLITRHVAAARLGLPTLEQLKRDLQPRWLPNGSIVSQLDVFYDGYQSHPYFVTCRTAGIYIENFALPLILNEMMLQSQNGVIKLFPSLDVERKAEFRTLRARGGFLVSAAVDRGLVLWAEILATEDQECRVRLPWPAWATTLKDTHANEALEVRVEQNDLVFMAHKGQTYRLEPILPDK